MISFSWEELHAQRNKVKATRLVENYSCPGGNQDKALSIKGIKSPTNLFYRPHGKLKRMLRLTET